MSQIIINAKNFERFSNRMKKMIGQLTQNQVVLGKLQSQEIFSQILGAENLHELRTNLNNQKVIPDYTYKLNKLEVDNFFKKQLSTEEEKNFISKLKSRMTYVIDRIADISGYDLVDWNFGSISHTDSPSILNCITLNYSPNTDKFKDDMKENISYIFEFINKKIISYDKYMNSFPTTWLYQEFETALINEVKVYSDKERKKQYVGDHFRKALK